MFDCEGGRNQFQQTAFRQYNDAVAIREHKAVHLRLDRVVAIIKFSISIVVKMTNVTNYGNMLHFLHVFASSSDETISEFDDCRRFLNSICLYGRV